MQLPKANTHRASLRWTRMQEGMSKAIHAFILLRLVVVLVAVVVVC
jgi:hypothetical protein